MSDLRLPPDRWRHDLKNQLGIILGFSELLLDEMDPADPRRADVEEIRTAAGRAIVLVGDPGLEKVTRP